MLEMWKSHWCSRSPPTMVLPLGVSSCKAHKHRSQILSWKSDPSTPFLCIPGWERSFADETEGTHKMWFKVAILSVSVTSPCPLRSSQAGFLIRASGRSRAGLRWRQLLLQERGRSYLMSQGTLTLDPQSLSSTDLMGCSMSFRLEQCFLNLRVHLFSCREDTFEVTLNCVHSFIHSFIR